MSIISNIVNKISGNPPIASGRLIVQCVEGRNLARHDILSKSDLYCQLSIVHKHTPTFLAASSQRTVVINNNQSPIWNQTFMFNITNPDTEILKIKVWDYDRMSFDDIIGEVDIPLFALHNGIPKDEWYQLVPAKGGSLHLVITAQGFGLPPNVGVGYQAGGYTLPQTPMGYGTMPPGYPPSGYPASAYPPPGYVGQYAPQTYPRFY